jgi:hypothetical protein
MNQQLANQMANQISIQMAKMKTTIDNVNGRVGVPILMYFLGVPGIVCVAVWLFFFRGH